MVSYSVLKAVALILSYELLTVFAQDIASRPNAILAMQAVVNETLIPFNLTSLPQPCRSNCEGTLASAWTCGTIQCFCSNERQTNITACVDCIVAVRPNDESITEGQRVVDRYVGNCNANQVGLTTQLVSGFTRADEAAPTAAGNLTGTTDGASVTPSPTSIGPAAPAATGSQPANAGPSSKVAGWWGTWVFAVALVVAHA